jgi:hypothetical protein
VREMKQVKILKLFSYHSHLSIAPAKLLPAVPSSPPSVCIRMRIAAWREPERCSTRST